MGRDGPVEPCCSSRIFSRIPASNSDLCFCCSACAPDIPRAQREMACPLKKKPGVERYLEFIVHLALLGLVDAVDVGHAQLLPLLRVALPLVPILLELR